MKKLKKSCVQNNDLSKSINKINKKKMVFSIVELIICTMFILFLTIPLIEETRHVYPIPDGQDMPDTISIYWSYISVGLYENNPIGLITAILYFLNIAIIIVWFIRNKSRESKNIYYTNIIRNKLCITCINSFM